MVLALAVMVESMVAQPSPLMQRFAALPAISVAPLVKSDSERGTAKGLTKVYRGPGENVVSLDNGLARISFDLGMNGATSGITHRGDASMTRNWAEPGLGINSVMKPLWTQSDGGWVLSSAGHGMIGKPFDLGTMMVPALWPPRGMGLRLSYTRPDLPAVQVDSVFELLDGEWAALHRMVIRNLGQAPIKLDRVEDASGEWPMQLSDGPEVDLVVRGGSAVEFHPRWILLEPKRAPEILKVTVPYGFRHLQGGVVAPALGTPAVEIREPVIVPATLVPYLFDLTSGEEKSVQDLTSAARKAGQAAILELDLTVLAAADAERTGGAGTPICLDSSFGLKIRQQLPLVVKRLGFQGVLLSGALPGSCGSKGHTAHQNLRDSAFENERKVRQLMESLVRQGVHVQSDLRLYGPVN